MTHYAQGGVLGTKSFVWQPEYFRWPTEEGSILKNMWLEFIFPVLSFDPTDLERPARTSKKLPDLRILQQRDRRVVSGEEPFAELP